MAVLRYSKSMTALSNENQLESLFKSALMHHESGELSKAIAQYQDVLRIDPDNPDALHLLGLIRQKMGDIHAASELIDKAVRLAPDFADYYVSRGDVYADQGNFEEAVSSYQKALELDANLSGAYFNMANAFYQMKDFSAAISAYEQALKINPDFPDALNNMGLVFHIQDNFDEAVTCFQKAVKIKPHYADAYNNLGNSLLKKGARSEAITSYEKAIELNPHHFDALYNMGNLYHARRDFEKALSYYQQAMSLKPDNVDVHINMGKTYHVKGDPKKAGFYYEKAAALTCEIPELHFYMGNAFLDQFKPDQAIACYRRLLHVEPDNIDALINMGIAYHNKNNLDDALSCYKKALNIDPNNEKAYNNLGKTFRDRLDLQNALSCYEKALELDPEYAEAHSNYAFVLLLSGYLEKGWKEYEWRLKEKNIFPASDAQPVWDGAAAMERPLVVYAEQGIGDEIMFASCLPDLMDRVGTCIVECDKRLVPLFQRSFPDIITITRGSIKDQAGSQIPANHMKVALGNLPLVLRRHEDDFPKRQRFLVPDQGKLEKWQTRFRTLGKGLCVGISWRAGSKKNTGPIRSIALKELQDALALSGIHIINLQYGSCEDELQEIYDTFGISIHHWDDADPLKDMDDFAAQIAALDLVISVDNSTVHLAGSLGVPVWTLLPFSPDWRWQLERRDSPWYGSMRLFRQKVQGDWAGVLREVKSELTKLIGRPNTPQGTAREIRPDDAAIHFNMGNSFRSQGRLNEAARHYLRAIAARPDYAEAHLNLGIAYHKMGMLKQAVESYSQAIEIRPDYAGAYLNLGIALMHQGKTQEAIQSYQNVLKIRPGYADAFYNLGNALKSNGNFHDALINYRNALQIDPDHAEAHRQIGVVHTYAVNDRDFTALLQSKKRLSSLSKGRQIGLHYALGKAYADILEYDTAFSHFQTGATLKRTSINYEISNDENLFHSIEKTYTKKHLDSIKNSGFESDLPIFIVGMPRSGTTLVEQILASHPDVYAAGELTELEKAANDNFLPNDIRRIDHGAFLDAGERYVTSLFKRAKEKEMTRITDKMPGNFLFMGYIHLALPKAKIIHCVRNPIDTCLSCYQKLFTEKHEWSYDLEELGYYYALYQRVMNHWKQVLPGFFIDVSYETMTSNPEEEIHRILEYCRLSWNDNCLSFHKTKRGITTASDVQVRRPIYTSSVGRWRQYEKHLGPLIAALEKNGVVYT